MIRRLKTVLAALAAFTLLAHPAAAQLTLRGFGTGGFGSLIAAPFASVNGPTDVFTCAATASSTAVLSPLFDLPRPSRTSLIIWPTCRNSAR